MNFWIVFYFPVDSHWTLLGLSPSDERGPLSPTHPARWIMCTNYIDCLQAVVVGTLRWNCSNAVLEKPDDLLHGLPEQAPERQVWGPNVTVGEMFFCLSLARIQNSLQCVVRMSSFRSLSLALIERWQWVPPSFPTMFRWCALRRGEGGCFFTSRFGQVSVFAKIMKSFVLFSEKKTRNPETFKN